MIYTETGPGPIFRADYPNGVRMVVERRDELAGHPCALVTRHGKLIDACQGADPTDPVAHARFGQWAAEAAVRRDPQSD